MNQQPAKPSCRIDILAEQRTIAAAPGDSLLDLLTANGILLRADCGGKGVCGKCLVEVVTDHPPNRLLPACGCKVDKDMTIAIPPASRISPHIVDKAEITLPASFAQTVGTDDGDVGHGIAVDLGTTTIAAYLVDRGGRRVLSSLAVKNPQSLYGDDVMSRIGYVGGSIQRLWRLQRLTAGAILWAIDALAAQFPELPELSTTMVVVGNPTMIQLLLGVSPASIGISPYVPSFFEARDNNSSTLGLGRRAETVRTLPQISGFIGGDILAAGVAAELASRPPGTLLIDLGTNGELLLRGEEGFFATSCATGPAFEGATISCGMQAVPGAIDRIRIDGRQQPSFTTIAGKGEMAGQPLGICGSGVISGVAAMLQAGVIEKSGAMAKDLPPPLIDEEAGVRRYLLAENGTGGKVAITQKDIRQVQLGKAALISGIEFLLAAAGMVTPTEILVAGAFGSHLDKHDLLALGMLPVIGPERITMIGNAAGSGAIMALCDDRYLQTARNMASQTKVINLAADPGFQEHFITRLSF